MDSGKKNMQKVTGMDADVVSPSNWCTSFSAVHGVAQSRSMKRKLDPKGTPVDQFRALRQIRGLSQEDCRRVIGLLRDDDLGAATCRKDQQKYPEASTKWYPQAISYVIRFAS